MTYQQFDRVTVVFNANPKRALQFSTAALAMAEVTRRLTATPFHKPLWYMSAELFDGMNVPDGSKEGAYVVAPYNSGDDTFHEFAHPAPVTIAQSRNGTPRIHHTTLQGKDTRGIRLALEITPTPFGFIGRWRGETSPTDAGEWSQVFDGTDSNRLCNDMIAAARGDLRLNPL